MEKIDIHFVCNYDLLLLYSHDLFGDIFFFVKALCVFIQLATCALFKEPVYKPNGKKGRTSIHAIVHLTPT